MNLTFAVTRIVFRFPHYTQILWQVDIQTGAKWPWEDKCIAAPIQFASINLNLLLSESQMVVSRITDISTSVASLVAATGCLLPLCYPPPHPSAVYLPLLFTGLCVRRAAGIRLGPASSG